MRTWLLIKNDVGGNVAVAVGCDVPINCLCIKHLAFVLIGVAGKTSSPSGCSGIKGVENTFFSGEDCARNGVQIAKRMWALSASVKLANGRGWVCRR